MFTGSFYQLIQPTEEVGRSQQWTSLAVARPLINLETIRDGFVQSFLPLLLLP